jgi:hypothetical protein
LFRIITHAFLDPRAAPGGEIGFVFFTSHFRLPQIGFVCTTEPAQAGRDRLERTVPPQVCPESAIRNSSAASPPLFLPPSNHESSTCHCERSAAITNPIVPLPRGRVARIVPEFWARATARNRVTPCAARNKEFFARGVFCLFNCCTNANKPCRTAALGCQNNRATDYRCLTAEDAPGRTRRRTDWELGTVNRERTIGDCSLTTQARRPPRKPSTLEPQTCHCERSAAICRLARVA